MHAAAADRRSGAPVSVKPDQWAQQQELPLECSGEVEWALYRQRVRSAIAVTSQRDIDALS